MESMRESWYRLEAFLEPYPWAPAMIGLALLLTLAVVAFYVTRRYLLRLVEGLVRRTEVRWDDALLERKIFGRASLAAPFVVVHRGIGMVAGLPEGMVTSVERLALVAMGFVLLLTLSALLSAANDIYQRYPIARGRPIKGYLQIVKIFLWIMGGVLLVALLLDRSPWFFMTGIGAMTAVLLLIFRDTILSLVASIQIVTNDMVRIGDWIEMDKYGADGDVVDIALHTIKVQNWDKTITTIPTYKLIDESFRNWRGMQEAGGRRIKRSLLMDLTTIRFLTTEDIDRFEKFVLLRDYIVGKREELERSNRDAAGKELVANSRRLTNIGTFRAYLVAYLRQHPGLYAEGMTFLVRQLQPGPEGLPIEIYVFTRTTAWAEYEAIQADIFDHLSAIVQEFELRLFQKPSGRDLHALRD